VVSTRLQGRTSTNKQATATPLHFTNTDQVLAQEAIKKLELKWLAFRQEEERGDPKDKRQRKRQGSCFAKGGGKIQPVVQGSLTGRKGSFASPPWFQSPKFWLSESEGAYPQRLQAPTGLPRVESDSRALGRGQTRIRMHPCQQPDLQPEGSLVPDT
jgi:hypothetical protein